MTSVRRRDASWAVTLLCALLIITAPTSGATLILTAIGEDGVVIRSDKRNTIKRRSGEVLYRDELNKVFVNADKTIIIYNHGINVINRVSWRERAAAVAAKLQESEAAGIEAAMDVVEATLAQDMAAELARNRLDHFSAFVVVMKLGDGRYRAGEVSWAQNRAVGKKALGRFILSGSGRKYCQRTEAQMTDAHWAKLTVEQAKAEIGVMFDDAVRRRDDAMGQEFSADFHELIVGP